MTENKVSFCGFVSFIKQKCVAGYYSNSIQTWCLEFIHAISAILLVIVLGIISLILLLYAFAISVGVAGYVNSTLTCYGVDCANSDKPIENVIIKYLPFQNDDHICCSCDLNSGKYAYYGKAIFGQVHNTCSTNGYINYMGTGILDFAFFVVLLVLTYLICLCIYFTLNILYKCIGSQWEEYIGKKIDARVRSLDGKQYMRLDVKDSNIIYPDDIESGKTYYQNTEVIKEELEPKSESESDSEDGVMVNVSDTEGYL